MNSLLKFNNSSFFTLISVMAVFILCHATNSHAALRAEVDYNFTNIDLDYGKSNRQWAHSFTQRYSLLYSKQDKLVNGRLGKYDVLLGYEFLAYDTKASENLKLSGHNSKGHILFSGSITIDPKEMPFKLTLYSKDNRNASITSTTIGSDISTRNNNVYNLAKGILAGTHLESGATLVAGVKNGMTNGYNEFLRHFPMILLDYKDSINKDSNSDNRLTQLAFVSLNKKENWFHYRYSIYNDNILPENNYKEAQMQIGTVDQALQRRWIDFTNWLQVSTDALYVNHNAQEFTNNFQEISINLFGIARRKNIDVYMYNSFLRRAENEYVLDSAANPYALTYKPQKVFTYSTNIPVYASGILNSSTRWDATVSYNETHTSDSRNFSKFNSGYNLQMFANSPFTFNQGTSLEYANYESANSVNDMIALTSKFETTSTPRYSNKLSLSASDVIRLYRYNQSSNSSSDFLDNELTAMGVYTNNTLRASLKQRIKNTLGRAGSLSSGINNTSASTAQYQSPLGISSIPDSTLDALTTVQIDWQPTARLSTGIAVTQGIYVDNTGASRSSSGVTSGLTYKQNLLTLISEFAYSQDSEGSRRISFKNSLMYTHSRNVDTFVKTIYTNYKDKYNSNDATYGDDLYIEQGLNVYLFKTNGVTRKLFEVNEIFKSGKNISNYALSSSTSAYTGRSNDLSLGVRYYPISALALGIGSRYTCADSFRPYVANYYLTAALTYQLFETSLDYNHGRNTFSGLLEKKFAVNMKKRF